MAETFLILMGGSGARVGRMITDLAASGYYNDVTDRIHMLLVDTHTAHKDYASLSLKIKLFDDLRRGFQLSSIGNDPHGFFKPEIILYEYNIKTGFGKINSGTITINDLVKTSLDNKDLLSSETYKGAQLLSQALYSKNELTQKDDGGYHGRPNIGTLSYTAIGKLIQRRTDILRNQGHDNSSDFLDIGFVRFKNALKSTSDNKKVFMVGSVYGGMGASGLSALMRDIKDTVGADTVIGATFLMPYFYLPPTPADPREHTKVDPARFLFASTTALEYYEKFNFLKNSGAGSAKFDVGYILGLDNLKIVDSHDTEASSVHSDGDSARTPLQLVELLAAVSFRHFLSDEAQSGQVYERYKAKNSQIDNSFYLDWGNLADFDLRLTLGKFFYAGILHCVYLWPDYNSAARIETAYKPAKEDFFANIHKMDSSDTNTTNNKEFLSKLNDYFIDFFKMLRIVHKTTDKSPDTINNGNQLGYSFSLQLINFKLLNLIIEEIGMDKTDPNKLRNKFIINIKNECKANMRRKTGSNSWGYFGEDIQDAGKDYLNKINAMYNKLVRKPHFSSCFQYLNDIHDAVTEAKL